MTTTQTTEMDAHHHVRLKSSMLVVVKNFCHGTSVEMTEVMVSLSKLVHHSVMMEIM